MDNLMGNKEWYEGLDKEVIGELVNKYQLDEGYDDLATEIDDEELLDDEVELVQSLKEKHAINQIPKGIISFSFVFFLILTIVLYSTPCFSIALFFIDISFFFFFV